MAFDSSPKARAKRLRLARQIMDAKTEEERRPLTAKLAELVDDKYLDLLEERVKTVTDLYVLKDRPAGDLTRAIALAHEQQQKFKLGKFH